MTASSTPRPLSVTIASVFVLSMTAWNMVRVYGTLIHWQIVQEFGGSPVYLLISGLGWALAGGWLSYVLWRGKKYAFTAGLALSLLYLGWYWLDRLVVQAAPAPNAVFSLFFSTLVLVSFTLNIVASKSFFDKESR